jgi:hypothetical protein
MTEQDFEEIDSSFTADFAIWRANSSINSFIEVMPNLISINLIFHKDIVNEMLAKLTDIKTQILNVEHEITVSDKP